MQFDMVHCSAPATLWNPGFVLASVLWAALLAYLLLEWRRTDRSTWKVIALSAVVTPVAVVLLSGLVALPSASCTVSGRWLWMAIPLAIPFAALALLRPRLDRIAVLARTIAVLTCLHAWWTVTLFSNDIAREVGAASLVGLGVKVAHAPWVAWLGVAPMLLIYVVLERSAPIESWRAWIAVRLQLLVATSALAAELRIASQSTVFVGEPEPLMVAPIIALPVVFAVQAWLKLKSLREAETTAA
jgi:hypothetical protein